MNDLAMALDSATKPGGEESARIAMALLDHYEGKKIEKSPSGIEDFATNPAS